MLWVPTKLSYTLEGADIHFNRRDFKAALHAPSYVDWQQCAARPVFIGEGGREGEGDLLADPIQKVLLQVIEATDRVLVGNGDYNIVFITNGTLLAIQNMTWGGRLGFRTAPNTPIDITYPDLQYASVFAEDGYPGVDGPEGVMGVHHYERGLMWAESFQTGHVQPQSQPRLTYRHLQWVLGRIDSL